MNVACIQRSPISSLPKVLGNRNVMSNPWFATTWQGAHVGGQNNRIFSQRIYKFPEEKNARRDITWKPAMVLCIRPFSSRNIGSRRGLHAGCRFSPPFSWRVKQKPKKRLWLCSHLYCIAFCAATKISLACVQTPSPLRFFFLGEGGGGLYTG